MRKLRTAMCLLTLSLTANTWAQEPVSCKKIRIAEIGWADITATNSIATVLAEGLGYSTQKIMASVPIAFTGVKNKQIDLYLGYWSPSMDPVIEPFIKAKQVNVLEKPNLIGAKYTLAVPTYAAEAGLKSFADIAKFKDDLQGRIYGIEPGNEGNDLIANMIKENKFGLGDFKMVESSESGMLVQVNRAIRDKRPVVFLGWEPHPMNNKFDLTYLSGGDEVFGPDYGAAKVYTVIPTDYQDRCPNAAKLFGNLEFNVGIESALMEKIVNKEDPNESAKNWISENPDSLNNWLEGVTTFDGKDGIKAVRDSLGI